MRVCENCENGLCLLLQTSQTKTYIEFRNVAVNKTKT